MEAHVEQAATAVPPPKRTRRSGKESVASNDAAIEVAPPHYAAEGSDPRVPFYHKIAEIGKQKWKELRTKLIGDLEEGYSSKEETSKADSSPPKDLDLLKELPSNGLRLILQSYHIWGALIGEELFDRFDQVMKVYDEQTCELAQEKKTREDAERRIAILEAKRSGVDAKWRGELEMKQSTIVNLYTHRTKQSATIEKLKEEIAKLGTIVENSQWEVTERGKHIKHLEEEVEAEMRARLLAKESARSDQLALQNLKVELEELRTAHQMALADAQSVETRLKYMISEEGKKEVIEANWHGPAGKVELSLAVKAGFDLQMFHNPPAPPNPLECRIVLILCRILRGEGQEFN